MGRIVLVGNGWHPPLFRAEVNALAGHSEIFHPRIVSVSQSNKNLENISGAALVDMAIKNTSTIKKCVDISENDIADSVVSWSDKNLPEGSFSVRARKLGKGVSDLSRRKIETLIGALLVCDENPVDLSNPEHEIIVILGGPEEGSIHTDETVKSEPVIVWGLKDSILTSGSYVGESPTDRPYFKPVTLDPRLARLMISLSQKDKKTTTIIDPFCGTGGIVIEASLLGYNVLASDLDPRMVEGTRKNISHLGLENTKAEVSDAGEIDKIWNKQSSCSFVFDPPYGRSAWKSGEGLDLVISALSAANRICPTATICTMMPTTADVLAGFLSNDQIVMGKRWQEVQDLIRKQGWKINLAIPIKVHKSLARIMIVCHPADSR